MESFLLFRFPFFENEGMTMEALMNIKRFFFLHLTPRNSQHLPSPSPQFSSPVELLVGIAWALPQYVPFCSLIMNFHETVIICQHFWKESELSGSGTEGCLCEGWQNYKSLNLMNGQVSLPLLSHEKLPFCASNWNFLPFLGSTKVNLSLFFSRRESKRVQNEIWKEE